MWSKIFIISLFVFWVAVIFILGFGVAKKPANISQPVINAIGPSATPEISPADSQILSDSQPASSTDQPFAADQPPSPQQNSTTQNPPASVQPAPPTSPPPAQTPPPPPAANGYTLAQVQTHNTQTDCWLVINNKVYNLTPYLAGGFHPEGEAIIAQYCGNDATLNFATKDKSRPKDHSAGAYADLAEYYIGDFIY